MCFYDKTGYRYGFLNDTHLSRMLGGLFSRGGLLYGGGRFLPFSREAKLSVEQALGKFRASQLYYQELVCDGEGNPNDEAGEYCRVAEGEPFVLFTVVTKDFGRIYRFCVTEPEKDRGLAHVFERRGRYGENAGLQELYAGRA